ncbi:diaminopimelate decarboxylase [Candidatus Marsarchaeota G1 archaeon BE_D]|jgi:diaminopimelate decarboxylase|uniref:Diaminopimelate decarboxylase n=1 Tax=Candidatus Marsarchaeota G1 archaeon BE_D TaxID=1978156 RepID=A0A2R6AGT4_9ARCH|nr:MAG: diaminopimelate decarboxylase [Candidatus Marsarchaeota G1 archaeon BE_D]
MSLFHESFEIKGENLFFDGFNLYELAQKHGTPLLVTSEKRLRNNYRTLFNAFTRHYRNIQINYALKANANPAIVCALAQEGCGADVSSPFELALARFCGVPVQKTIFSPNYASLEELMFGVESGAILNFDDIEQFRLIPKSPEVVSFRVNPGFGKGEFQGVVTAGPEAKFGVPADRVIAGYELALKRNVKRFGIHAMVGSNVLDPSHFERVTRAVVECALEVQRKLSVNFEFVDIGGGFGVPYKPTEERLNVEEVARRVTKIVRESGLGNPTLILEPGRYLVADTTILLTKVNHVKNYTKTFVGVDCGMNVLIRPALYGAYHHIVVVNKMDQPVRVKANVVGQICENTDVLGTDVQLPEVNRGDVLAILNAGAYVYAMSSQYNLRPRPKELLIDREGRVHVIRQAEEWCDMVRHTNVPPHLLP